MCAEVSHKQAIRALQRIQRFTSRPVTIVIGQEGFVVTVDRKVYGRISEAAQRGDDTGTTALAVLRAYAAQGMSLHDVVAQNRDIFQRSGEGSGQRSRSGVRRSA